MNVVVGLATVVQYAAAILALRVLRITGRDPTWLLIAAVAFLMAIRRSIVLYRSLSHDAVNPPDMLGESVGLAISVLMLVGVARIGPFFLSILRSREELRKRSDALAQRVKELNCLYGMANLVEQPDSSLKRILQGTVALIPDAWPRPELTCARIKLKEQSYGTTNFEETRQCLACDIVARGEPVGAVEVGHLADRLETDEGPFTEEERKLIKAIAGRLGRIIERTQIEEDRAALQDQLHQAHKMEAVGQLAAGVAHDFSNLLTVIRGHTDRATTLLADGAQARKELELVQEATHQAAELTRGLLTFSRKLPTEKKPIDLRTVVRESERLLHRVLPAATELEVDIACEAPLWVNADQTQLQQVVLNLAVNARDAMPDGGTIRITLSAANETDVGDLPDTLDTAGRTARLTVADSGVGMTPEVQSRIFEPFYTTKTRGQGTGLGLSIVHGVVKDHGGRIEVQSEVNEGTTLTIVLPCIEAGPTPETAEPSTIVPQGAGELILLAEDDSHVRAIIASTLESLGYEVVQAKDGLALLDAFEQHHDAVGLLLLDADLPERSGPDCLRQIRQKGVGTPALMISGDVSLDPNELDDQTVLLRKPFGMPELAEAVAHALAADRPRGKQP